MHAPLSSTTNTHMQTTGPSTSPPLALGLGSYSCSHVSYSYSWPGCLDPVLYQAVQGPPHTPTHGLRRVPCTHPGSFLHTPWITLTRVLYSPMCCPPLPPLHPPPLPPSLQVPPSQCVMLASTVSSKMLAAVAAKEGFQFQETLTGFKWLGNTALGLEQVG